MSTERKDGTPPSDPPDSRPDSEKPWLAGDPDHILFPLTYVPGVIPEKKSKAWEDALRIAELSKGRSLDEILSAEADEDTPDSDNES